MPKRTLEIEFEEFDSADELTVDEQELIKRAWAARENAYAPYSEFKVGAALLTKNALIFFGSNQERANYRVSCAERVALDTAGAEGYRELIAKLAVVGGSAYLSPNGEPEDIEEPVTPCGQCRQDIKEVEDSTGEPIVIITASRNKVRRFLGIDNLLPFAFGPKDLGIDPSKEQ